MDLVKTRQIVNMVHAFSWRINEELANESKAREA